MRSDPRRKTGGRMCRGWNRGNRNRRLRIANYCGISHLSKHIWYPHITMSVTISFLNSPYPTSSTSSRRFSRCWTLPPQQYWPTTLVTKFAKTNESTPIRYFQNPNQNYKFLILNQTYARLSNPKWIDSTFLMVQNSKIETKTTKF